VQKLKTKIERQIKLKKQKENCKKVVNFFLKIVIKLSKRCKKIKILKLVGEEGEEGEGEEGDL
jgi:hypothetical protein